MATWRDVGRPVVVGRVRVQRQESGDRRRRWKAMCVNQSILLDAGQVEDLADALDEVCEREQRGW